LNPHAGTALCSYSHNKALSTIKIDFESFVILFVNKKRRLANVEKRYSFYRFLQKE